MIIVFVNKDPASTTNKVNTNLFSSFLFILSKQVLLASPPVRVLVHLTLWENLNW